MNRRPLVAGNWKMNMYKGDGVELAKGVADKYTSLTNPACDVLVCPPALIVDAVASAVKGKIFVGTQDASALANGAHTGDISVTQIKDIGATYAIVGHSERRADHGETNEIVCAKAKALIDNGITAVICIGETLAQRDAGKTIEVCRTQIQGSVPENATAENVVIAYEPVWAIGTGKTPTSLDVEDVHSAVRAEIAAKLGADVANKMRILYGGSVKPSNAKELMALPDVDGALVGGASLKVADFSAIIDACL
ncbi:MAG: triose-phosphate isomerase [Alphaproteobacteria bacterium]|nr:triose-phosphate isomerase [Alphaproteobacteria bacterium]